jgi:quinoprotein glucose dehydrogenase
MIAVMRAIYLPSILCLAASVSTSQQPADAGWSTYGGDLGGQHYSAAAIITKDNISRLHPVWTYHTKALDSNRPGTLSAAFESTPILYRDALIFTTPFDKVVALNPLTGTEKWTFDPQIPRGDLMEGMLITSRGVAVWEGAKNGVSNGPPCENRVFLGTLVGQLLSLDAATGKPCEDFGKHGRVDLRDGVHYVYGDSYAVTSAPTVIGNVVVVGSSIADNVSVDIEAGVVRGFDVRTGKMLWHWDPIPWSEKQTIRTGAANSWSTISADPALNLVYVPTGSASPDYYGGMRKGDDRDADSVVALDASTGRKIWAFQTVHHDLWDYDVASEPVLFTFHGTTPAIAITTKTGMVFVLDRRDGKPLYPITEKPVPQTDVPGEETSPTQPFSSLPPLSSLDLASPATGTWRRSAENQAYCDKQIAALRYEGVYTPPSVRGSMIYPGNIGGVNWGSPALDPVTATLYANTNHLAFAIHLIDHPAALKPPIYVSRKNWVLFGVMVVLLGCVLRRSINPGWVGLAGIALAATAVIAISIQRHNAITGNIEASFGRGLSPQMKTPYQLLREPLYDHDRNPCVPPPWGTLTALNLNTGKIEWNRSLGTTDQGGNTGSLSLGGPILTSNGLLFTAGTRERKIRAYDAKSGEEIWKADLPVPAQSTPMTYSVGGRQFVLIAAGGHGTFRTPQGDSLIAFGLQ